MKLQLCESHPGELDAASHAERRAMLRKAVSVIAQHAGVVGAEVDVVDDLVVLLDRSYQQRRERMLQDVARAVIDGRAK